MSSRPKHVSSLSDKIAGLKFMQRAKAVQDQHQQPQPSSSIASSGTLEAKVPRDEAVKRHAVEPEDDANEEHWSLPVSRHTPIKHIASSTSIVSHEPGWNAWLSGADDTLPSASTTALGMSSRRSFGTWVKKRKSKEGSPSDKKRSQTPESEGQSDKDSSDESSESSEETIESGSFIKPGSIKSDTSTLSRKEHKSNRRGQSAIDTRKGQRKVPQSTSKRRPSRDALAGFPDHSTTQHKTKKSKTQ